MANLRDTRWTQFLKEISNLIFFWIFGIIFFTIFRAIFICSFAHEIRETTGLTDYLNTFFTGFRFDNSAISYFILIPLAATLILSPFSKFGIIKKVRITFQYIFVILSSIICLVSLSYYQEFNEQFNNFLFLSLHDDQAAIAETIWTYHNPILKTLTLIIVITIGVFIFNFFEKKTWIYQQLNRIKPAKINLTLFVLIAIALFVFSMRGTIAGKPAIRRWAATSTDPFLNKTIINPYRSLKYAHSDYKLVSTITKDNPFGEIGKADFEGKNKISDIIERKAKGTNLEKPKQVFLIIMEAYDMWPLMDEYRPFGISDELSRIADNGTLFYNFLPAYNATYYAYASIVTSTPCFGLNINVLSKKNEPYISSVFTQFKKMGYKTNLFYGGHASWENIGSFTFDQGCDNVYTAIDIGAEIVDGGWGIMDEYLFDYVLETLDPEEYTFNVILTSSNHSPYSLDIYSRGYKYHTTEDLPKDMQKYYAGGVSLVELGHYWYGDWALGQFMNEAEQKYQSAMYGFTGDHFSRKFVGGNPNLYISSAVPFILYGNGIDQQKLSTPGGHADIAPTMIELVAPENFTYYSFGTSMLDSTKCIGVGNEKMIFQDSLFYTPKGVDTKFVDLKTMQEGTLENFAHREEYNKIMRLSWQYIAKGDSLVIKE